MIKKTNKIIFLGFLLFLIGLTGGFIRPVFSYSNNQESVQQTEEQRKQTLKEQQRLLEIEKARLEAELKTLRNTNNTLSESNLAEKKRTKEESSKKKEEILKKLEELKTEKEKEIKLNQEELIKKAKEMLSDERKSQIVEKLSKQLNFINDKITDNYLRYLEKFGKILDKMETRAENLEQEGYSTSDIKNKIQAARDAILKANEKVLIQKAKIYTFKIDNEENIGKIFSESRKELKNDLEILKKEVISPIKEIIREIHQSFGLLKRESKNSVTPPQGSNATPEISNE